MRRRALVAVVALLALLAPQVARAHTEVDHTTPADGELVDDPVTQVVVAFTEPVTVVGDGFEILDPAGNIVEPVVETPDDTVFTLTVDDPLAGGDVGVRFEVESEDGHVVTGAFVFTVATEASTTTTTSEPSSSAPTTSTPSSEPTTTQTTVVVTTVTDDVAGEGTGSPTGLLIVLGAAAVLGVLGWFWARSRRPM